MNRPRRTPPRWVRYTLSVVALLVPCVVFGVTTATADLSLGPHEARYEVTTDSLVVVDLGPLGTLEIDSPLPAGLGARITVEEIPADLTAFDQATTIAALTQDLQGYLQFFGGPQDTIEQVTRSLVADAARRTGLAILVVAGAGAGFYLLLGAARRREIGEAVAPRTWEITAGVVVVSLVFGALSASAEEPSTTDSRPASAVFAGTPLEGARITGRLAGVVDTYGGMLMNAYKDNEAFYARANTALGVAWDERDVLEEEVAARREADEQAARDAATEPPAEGQQGVDGGVAGVPAGPADPTGADGAAEDPAGEAPSGSEGDRAAEGAEGSAARRGATPSAGSTESPSATPEDELVSMLVVSDLHCNIGMTPLIRTAAERSGASIVLNAGDTTMNGTSVEQFCVNSFTSAVPDGATMVVADGNHDSVETSTQERKRGVKILDGDVIEVDGVRILGDRDALETRIGAGSKAARPETPAEQAERLAQAACDAKDGIDLLLVHSPRAGNEALETGCVPLQVSGHTHRRSGPEQFGLGIRYVNASTAGAESGEPTVGPLKGVAEMTVLRFDPVLREFVDWQLVQVFPDGSAQVGPREAFPVPVPEEVLDGTGEGTEAPDGTGTGDGTDGTGAVDGQDGSGVTDGAPAATITDDSAKEE
ncbi:metallophosphoesterase family protein [Oerskovia enterophila]|uniref:Calcineurin-like phosphoesterase superfamily domain protein n=1 Tax=Oerskovia enterophila TaxID=43678 RepID=A0ABX2Y685_9CELL|nr:metallophosphoesterase [Oerskovia enterophila]OCI30416.1 calcineurin-like phosphoesterase superfamily domain protein [Oerskovia enterophila]